jgi:F-type H+-transporting ATPase subunit gamma
MANLRDVRLRIRAVEQTLQVTKAMKLISTAKLRKSRKMLANAEPYFKRIQKSMFDIISGTGNVQSDFVHRAEESKSSRTAIIVITSDKGLAGGYNANVFRLVNDLCSRVKNPMLTLIGAIGFRYFAHSSHTILENFSFHSQIPTLDHAEEIAEYIVSQYMWEMFDEIHIVYTHMFNAVKLLPTERQILPLDAKIIQNELTEIGGEKRVELQFEYLPSAEEVLDILVPQYVKGVIYGAMVESYASEQNARMTAMDEASKNAEEMLASLRINYNRARQAGITQEMTEISGGAAALADK